MNWETMARMLIGLGILLLAGGLLLLLFSRMGWSQFHIPGDVYIKRGNFSFYFPLGTCILLSILLTLVLSWLGRR